MAIIRVAVRETMRAPLKPRTSQHDRIEGFRHYAERRQFVSAPLSQLSGRWRCVLYSYALFGHFAIPEKIVFIRLIAVVFPACLRV